jgi:exonuclease SbcC
MHIVDVKLENIKSHKNSRFEFNRGTTAIMGENGAGKTTIIEAVAWALFDLLDYKKDDFVRRGQKKGSVHVTFESGLDERKYTVYRDTGTGYNIVDPQLGTKIRDKKEDVTAFLRQHLGVEPGTDLELLFRSAIGVPQGTFTAIFLDTAARRKETFDRLLKVEEYRQGADKLLATTRFVENRIAEVREKIARAEGELANFDLVESELKDITAHLDGLRTSFESLQKGVDEKQGEAKKFEAEEVNINNLKAALEKLRSEFSRSEILLQQKQTEVESARQAAEKLKAVEADNEIHVAALASLKDLDSQRLERDKLQTELTAIETSLIRNEAEQKNLASALERAENAARELAVLTPQIVQQNALEKRRETLRTAQAQAKAHIEQASAIDARLLALRESYSRTTTELKEAEEKSKLSEQADALGLQELELANRLARLRATLEHDEIFRGQIQNGFCPVLSEKCLNLKEGQTLESFLSGQFDELKADIRNVEKTQAEIAAQIMTAREGAKFLKAMDTLRRRQEEITEEGKSLRKERDAADKYFTDLPKIETDLTATEKSLAELKSPRERADAIRGEATAVPVVKEKLAENEKNTAVFSEKKTITGKALEKFAALDVDWAKFSADRDRTAEAHREYLTNEVLARSLPERADELEKLVNENTKLKADIATSENAFAEASKHYDLEKHQILKGELLTAERSLAETGTRLSITGQRQSVLEKDLERLKEIRVTMQTEFKEKDRLEKIGEATKFIRDTLKEAAPRVARNYVYHVSNEANQLYREITGNPERSLKWGEDYALQLEEGGYERPFQSLSGGEQMAAALSIRLALLKQLSDVKMAFFDEPTTNMDEIRREHLAEQISHITENHTFDQLFVISHDDTFEGYVDNIVTVGGEKDEDLSEAAFALTP